MGNQQNSGRRRKPNALRLLGGVTRKDRLNPDEPRPVGPVEKPANLSKSAAEVWDLIAPICLQMGTLTPADVPAFVRLCELQATAEAASAQKDAPGFSIFIHTTMVDSAGNEHQQVKVHPAIKIEGETSVKLRPYYDYFGMTPSGRAKLTVPKAAEPETKWSAMGLG